MKRCQRCDRVHPDTDNQCPYCHYVDEEPAVVAGHIDYLLGEIPQWVNRSWLDREKATLLRDIYTRRRDSLSPPKPSGIPFTLARPPLVVERQPEPVAPPPARRTHPLAAFLEERNISYWHLVGAILLLAGLSGLVRYTWDSWGKYLVFVLMMAVTAGFYWLGKTLSAQNHRVTGWALRAVALLLVPLDLIAVNAFALSGLHLTTNEIGLAVAAICLPLYAWRAIREKLRCFDILLTINIAATLHFALQLALPRLLHNHSIYAVYAAYGFFYLPVALVYIFAASRAGDAERRLTWLVSAHAMAIASLVLAVWPSGGRVIGDASATVLLAALLYTAATFLLDDPLYGWLSTLLACVGGALAFSRHEPAAWYAYAILTQAVAVAGVLLGRLQTAQGRSETAQGYTVSSWVLAVSSLIIQLYGLVVVVAAFPWTRIAGANLYGALVAATLSLGFLVWLAKAAPVQTMVGYLFVLAGLTLAHILPKGTLWHDQPNIALPLALAAIFFLATVTANRRAVMVAALTSLLVCIICAAQGYGYITALTTLVLLAGATAAGAFWQAENISIFDRRALVWAMSGSLALGVMLWQTHLLTFLAGHIHWERNYGYGVLPLIVLFVVLGRALVRRGNGDLAMTAYQAAGAAAVAATVGQLAGSYAGLAYSPLALLFIGMAVTGIWAARYRSHVAALATALLAASIYGAYLLSLPGQSVAALMYPAHSIGHRVGVIRETILIASLLAATALTALIAFRLQARAYISFAFYSFMLAYLYTVHLVRDPAHLVYSLCFLPFAALAYAASYLRRPASGDLWRTPLRDGALIVSLLATGPALIALLNGPSHTIDPRGLWVLAGYALLWAAVFIAGREIAYVYLAGLAVSFGVSYGLFGHVASTGMIGFYLSLAALAWAAVAAGVAAAAKVREDVTVALHTIATITVAGALLFALLGDGADHSEMHALLVAGTVFFANLWRLRHEIWRHLGVAAYLWAYFIFISPGLGNPDLANLDLYAAPVGLYLLLLGFLAHRQSRADGAAGAQQGYYLVGLFMILTPTLLAIHHSRLPAIRASLLATECVAAIFYGLSARIKLFVGMGTVFLLALIAVEAQGNVTTVAWAIYATALGLVIIASALVIERRREDFARWTQNVREKIKDWE